MMRSDAAFRPPMPVATPPESSFRRSGERIWRAGRLLLLAGILAVCCLRPARAEITLDALVGFGQSSASTARYRPETWTPVTIFLTGQGVRGIGQLTVTTRQGQHTRTYTRRVSLHEG